MPVMIAAFLMVGCERLSGQLNISKDLKLVNSKGDTHLLRVGTYTADLRQSTFGKKIVLRLNEDADEKFNFAIPKGTKIPNNGTFSLKSNQIGQKVDLKGTVATTHVDSPEREGYQSCTYSEPYTVCQPAGPYGQMQCQTYMRTIYGQQWVRSFDRTTHQDITLDITPVSAKESSGQFTGNASWVEQIVVNQTNCR
jgi:hypothetical protein